MQGIGIEEILEAVVQRIPPPPNRSSEPLRALIFDSYYDSYKVLLDSGSVHFGRDAIISC